MLISGGMALILKLTCICNQIIVLKVYFKARKYLKCEFIIK